MDNFHPPWWGVCQMVSESESSSLEALAPSAAETGSRSKIINCCIISGTGPLAYASCLSFFFPQNIFMGFI